MRKHIKTLILSIFLVFSLFTGHAQAEFFPDIIVTSPNGIWTDSRAYSTLNAAIAAIGTNTRTVKIVTPQVVTALTIPSNVTLEFDRNGSITNSGQLTINTKNIIAPNRQIFTGSGNIDFASGSVLKTGWFNSIESAFALTTNDTVTLIVSKPQTITASYSPGNNVHLKWESPGNILTINVGIVVSNIGHIEAGHYQIFAGAGDLDFLDGTVLSLSWFSHLRSAITFIETEKVTLTVAKSSDVDFSDTVQSNISLVTNSGGILTIKTGITLDILGPFTANGQAFICQGTGKVTGLRYVTDEMFGTVGTGVVNDIIPFQKALDALADGGTFRADRSKSYLFGALGDGEVFLIGSGKTFDFAGSTLIGSVIVGDRIGSPIPQDLTIIGGIYAPGSHALNPLIRWETWWAGLGIILGNRIHVINPVFIVAAATTGLSIQTDASVGIGPLYHNLRNIIVDNPIIIGNGTTSINGLDIGSAGERNDMVADVVVNNPVISGCRNGIILSHSSAGDYHNSRIHINNARIDSISDMSAYLYQNFDSSISGSITNFSWVGLRTYKADNSIFDLAIIGSDSLAIPPFNILDPYYSTQVPVAVWAGSGASSPIVNFSNIFISGKDSTNKIPIGFSAVGYGASIGQGVFQNCDLAIEENGYKVFLGNIIIGDGVTSYPGYHNYAGAAADWWLVGIDVQSSLIRVSNANGNVIAKMAAALLVPGRLYTVVNGSGFVLTFTVHGQTGGTIANGKTAVYVAGLVDVHEVYEQP